MILLIVIFAVTAIFALAICRAAAPQSETEQKMDDMDQRRYLQDWKKRNC